LRVGISSPSSTRPWQGCMDSLRHQCLGWAAQRSQTTFVRLPGRLSFWPHLPEKYDGSINPSEFLQVYITAIMAAGGNDAVMASYFHVALTGPAQTWLMNLTPGSIQSWGELCA
jgi:hypothetical protein